MRSLAVNVAARGRLAVAGLLGLHLVDLLLGWLLVGRWLHLLVGSTGVRRVLHRLCLGLLGRILRLCVLGLLHILYRLHVPDRLLHGLRGVLLLRGLRLGLGLREHHQARGWLLLHSHGLLLYLLLLLNLPLLWLLSRLRVLLLTVLLEVLNGQARTAKGACINLPIEHRS